MSQVNLQALAKELGLSIATVSKALRDSHEISLATKKQVTDLAKKLNYSPNPYASSLRRKRSNTIAVVIPDVADSFFSLAIRGINEIAQSKGYHVLIYLTYEHYETELKILEDCRNGRVDGVLISAASETASFQHVEALMKEKVPVVFFDRAPERSSFSKVVTDDFDSACNATLHLIERSCRNIVYLSISTTMDMNHQRISGFTKALQQHHLYSDHHQIVACTNEVETNREIIHQLLTTEKPPDGMLLSVEKLIIPVYNLCQELQINIPAQLKVICFTTTEYAGVLQPTLTTVRQPATDIGRNAATILFKALRKAKADTEPECITISSTLYPGGSTAANAG